MSVVRITGAALEIEELLDVVGGARVELAPDARSRIAASNAVVDEALRSGGAIYGLSTGVGHGKDVRLSEQQLRAQQELLIETHAGGLGEALSAELVRAAIMVRLNGIARGGSGVTPAAADILAAMLNAGIHPVVPSVGSVGAGDLPQMAGIARVAIGRGRAQADGARLPGAEALRRAGIPPLVLGPKDGLGLMSANGISIGHAAIVVARAERVAEMVDVALALSLEVLAGNPSISLPAVADAKPYRGLIDSAECIRAALEGSYLWDAESPKSVQDPLSFRVAPQVHGAFRDALAMVRHSVEVELNSMSDNPLVSIADGAMVHNGNFHPIALALACDAFRVAAAHVGQIAERRMSHLWDAFFAAAADIQPNAGAPVPVFAGLSLRYPAAAVFTRLKQLSAPATLDCPPLDMGIEDHATSAPLGVRQADEALELLEDLVVIEMLLARDVLTAAASAALLGTRTSDVLGAAEAVIDANPSSAPDEIHGALRAELFEEVVYRPQ